MGRQLQTKYCFMPGPANKVNFEPCMRQMWLTLILLNTTTPIFANSVDQNHMDSEEAI